MSHSLIRTIRPHGHLHTFDFHKQRVELATAEFKKHGIGEFVTVTHRDVCLEGFGDALKHKVDAVFLDLPHPWLTINHAVDALKESGGKLCSFSPCIEQVQQTCIQLEATGFVDIRTHECLQKELTVVYKNVPKLNLDCLKKKVRQSLNYYFTIDINKELIKNIHLISSTRWKKLWKKNLVNKTKY